MLIYGINTVLTREKEREKEKDRENALANGNPTFSPGSSTLAPGNPPATNPDGSTTTQPQLSTALIHPPTPNPSIYPITAEMVGSALETLEDGPVKSMIRDCLNPIPDMRPSAKDLLFHPAFFEVPPLKQIAAFAFVDYFCESGKILPLIFQASSS